MYTFEQTFGSLEEMMESAMPHILSGTYAHATPNGGIDRQFDFHGTKSVKHLKEMVRDGWEENLSAVVETAETVVSDLFKEHTGLGFKSYYDVSGGEVDIDRFLVGEPEHMIEYALTETPKFGRVITLVSSVTFSASISKEAIAKRGHLVSALAIALSRLGFGLEIWADVSINNTMFGNDMGKGRSRQRVLIKPASDELDIGRVMYAFTHPSVLRILGLANQHNMPRDRWGQFGMDGGFGGYGSVVDPWEDMPEGTIYLPGIKSETDVPDADVHLRQIMTELGIIAE